MRHRSILLVLTLVAVALLAVPAAPVAAYDDVVDRIAGPDRVATAVEASRYGFEAAATVVLASAGDVPDALAAGPLARAVGGPLLLTPGDALPPDVAEEIARHGAQEVVLVGG